MARPALEIADIFRDHGSAWRQANAGHVSLGQLKVMSAIESCRTAALVDLEGMPTRIRRRSHLTRGTVPIMSWQHIRITRFGCPEGLELAGQPTISEPGPGAGHITILAAAT